MVVKAEVIYQGGTYPLIKDNQTGHYIAEIEAFKRELKTVQNVSYYPIMLRVTDEAGNTTIKTVSDAVVGKDLVLTVKEIDVFPMQFIVADRDGVELGFADTMCDVDLDIGNTEDFEMTLPICEDTIKLYDFGCRLFIPNTEYGGLLEDRKTSTKQNTITYNGYTWRGLLGQKVIEPQAGQTHLTVSGEANTIIGQILGSRFDGLYMVDTVNSGIEIQNYQFDRYTTVLAGLTKMLATKQARLHIYYKRGEGLESGAVHVCAVPIKDWSEELSYSQDNKVHFTTRDYRMGINHLICAGEGEGIDRAILHLYLQADGSIGDKQHYFELEERTALYSYTSQEDVDKLREDGIKRLKGLLNYKKFEVTLDDADVELGDIIGGYEQITKLEIKRPVVGKILKASNGKTTIEYKIKGDD